MSVVMLKGKYIFMQVDGPPKKKSKQKRAWMEVVIRLHLKKAQRILEFREINFVVKYSWDKLLMMMI